MKLLPVHLDLAKFTLKDHFPAVRITPTATEATNGHLLVRASIPAIPEDAPIPTSILVAPQTVPSTASIDASPSGIAVTRKDGSLLTAPCVDAPTFPDTTSFIRAESEDILAVWLNPIYLRDICAWFAKHDSASFPSIRLGFHTPTAPLTIRATSGDGVEMLAVLMPMRGPKERN